MEAESVRYLPDEWRPALAAPVRALDPRHRYGSEGLSEGDVIAVGDVELRVVGTPGHSSDSLSFHLVAEQAVLTGENTRLEKAWTEHYRRTGTYHALVISGLHLTVLAG